MLLGAMCGFFALISLFLDVLGHVSLSYPHFLWSPVCSAAALVCWIAASGTAGRIGPGVASALLSILTASAVLCVAVIVIRAYLLALALGSVAILVSVVLLRFRGVWGAV